VTAERAVRAPDRGPVLSVYRTLSHGKFSKITYAASGLALAAALAGTISVWGASAKPAASARSASPAVRPDPQAADAPPIGSALLRTPASGVHAGQAATFGLVHPGRQAVVLDAFTAVKAAATTLSAGSRHHRRVRLTPRQIARRMLRSFRWAASQFRYLNDLWSRESSWNVYASNPYSGAYGIPQAVPGDKMASAGRDWESSARTQIRWGLRYIKGQYGSPYGAWEHELATGWY
jgi:hypothetical protein